MQLPHRRAQPSYGALTELLTELHLGPQPILAAAPGPQQGAIFGLNAAQASVIHHTAYCTELCVHGRVRTGTCVERHAWLGAAPWPCLSFFLWHDGHPFGALSDARQQIGSSEGLATTGSPWRQRICFWAEGTRNSCWPSEDTGRLDRIGATPMGTGSRENSSRWQSSSDGVGMGLWLVWAGRIEFSYIGAAAGLHVQR